MDYHGALSLIFDTANVTEKETVSLLECLGRIPVRDLKAFRPDPGYDQSLRDGFALSREAAGSDDNDSFYRISGEVPAGSLTHVVLEAGFACRIMTGALLPENCLAVVPQELCRVDGDRLFVPHKIHNIREDYIQKQGSRIASGAIIAQHGKPICAGDVATMAITGVTQLEVYRKPKVAFFCSGNELVDIADNFRPGQKVSSNRYLLHCLLKANGAICDDRLTVRDSRQCLDDMFSEISASDNDIIISTGGLGPGKYDLLEAAFVNVGGKLLYRSLMVRPGKVTLFGLLGDKLYFGLPGPPMAVGILFNELIRPALRKMQGISTFANIDYKAFLDEDIVNEISGILSFRKGIVNDSDTTRGVRVAGRLETGDCLILLPPGCSSYRKGDSVIIHDTKGTTFS